MKFEKARVMNNGYFTFKEQANKAGRRFIICNSIY